MSYLKKLAKIAKTEIDKHDDHVDCVVGYTQQYAVYVHENLEAHHPVGQAKFLEQPFRENEDKYTGIIVTAMQNDVPFAKALLLAGLSLQRDSQELVPVDTGALKGSAFTKLEYHVA